MKKVLLALIGILVFATGSGLVAQNYERQRLELNSTAQCEKAQIYIENTLRKNDLRGRVNRLQIYEYVYRNIDAFTARLENNEQASAKTMRQHANNLRTEIDEFVKNYETYDELRDSIVAVKSCEENAKEFDTAVLRAQKARAKLHQNIKNIENLTRVDTQSTLDSMYTELLRTGSSQELES